MKKCIDCGKKILKVSKRCITCHNKSPEMRVRTPHNFVDLSGHRFNRLVVLCENPNQERGQIKWECVCDCGKFTSTTTGHLRSGHTKSCGCLEIENRIKHGMHGTRFNQTYRSVRYRCSNPKASKYHLYGGKGIKCLWTSFEEFRDDMYESYQSHVEKFGEKETTIDRIDGNKQYCKENCRWATRTEQARNTKNVIRLSFDGKTLTLGEWAEVFGVRKKTIANRIYSGWSIEKALTQK